MGVAIYPEHGEQYEYLLKCADHALYRAKREGRDRVVMYDSIIPRPGECLKLLYYVVFNLNNPLEISYIPTIFTTSL